MSNPTSALTPINLLRGVPNPSLLPAALLREAASKVLSNKSVYSDALVYGPDPGYEPLRDSIAQWLSEFYQPTAGPVTSNRVCITGGASQNLGCVLNVFTDPSYTRKIWIVAPAYFLAFRIFEDAGFAGQMRAVPEDEEGLDIEFLRREIRKSEEDAQARGMNRPRYKPERMRAKVYKHIIYCVPTFANPSSRTMSLSRRETLIRLAREYDALVVCDDVYDFLQWPAANVGNGQILKTAHLPRIVDIDRYIGGGFDRKGADGFGNAVSNGSFSKIVAPGVRVGWTEASEKLTYGISQTGTTCSGGAPSQLTSTYINLLLQPGASIDQYKRALDDHIQHILLWAYSRRYNTLMATVKKFLLPLGFTVPQPGRNVIGGFFLWLGLPDGLKADPLATKCKSDTNVILAPGSMFEIPGDDSIKFERNIRVCWAWEEEDLLAEGIRRVAQVAKEMLDAGDEGDFVVVEKNAEDDSAAEFK